MRLVIIESPYAGDVERNLRYLRACMADCIERNEVPFASHGLYTQEGVLDDTNALERERGIQAGFAWRGAAEATVVYRDLGYSRGMLLGIDDALAKIRAAIQWHGTPYRRFALDHTIEYRELGEKWIRIEEFNAALEAW
jgi:hypothetical protein